MKKKLYNIAKEDGRYSFEVIKFVNEALGYTIKNLADKPGHITGKVFCLGLQRLAIKKWGRLAKLVLNTGGVKVTRDIGEIVFIMVENHWMSAQPTDSIEDFDDIYDFEAVFKKQFTF